MPGSTFGTLFRVTTAGESHGPANVTIIDGCPAGLPLSEADLQPDLDRRRPGQSKVTSPRQEADRAEILSGVFEGKTTGAPIAVLVRSRDARSKDYEALREVYRPGHADFSYEAKYGVRDHRGGGRSSARETVSRVVAGAIARKLLREAAGVEVVGYVRSVGEIDAAVPTPAAVTRSAVETLADGSPNVVRCPDPEAAEKMVALIDEVRNEGDSVGGIAEIVATGVPAGLGEPVFDKLKADFGKALLSLPAVVGVEYGAGFAAARMRGSAHNDAFAPRVVVSSIPAPGTVSGTEHTLRSLPAAPDTDRAPPPAEKETVRGIKRPVRRKDTAVDQPAADGTASTVVGIKRPRKATIQGRVPELPPEKLAELVEPGGEADADGQRRYHEPSTDRRRDTDRGPGPEEDEATPPGLAGAIVTAPDGGAHDGGDEDGRSWVAGWRARSERPPPPDADSADAPDSDAPPDAAGDKKMKGRRFMPTLVSHPPAPEPTSVQHRSFPPPAAGSTRPSSLPPSGPDAPEPVKGAPLARLPLRPVLHQGADEPATDDEADDGQFEEPADEHRFDGNAALQTPTSDSPERFASTVVPATEMAHLLAERDSHLGAPRAPSAEPPASPVKAVPTDHTPPVVTTTNRHGGMLGGISTGMPIVIRCAIKPTSSLPQAQATTDRAGNPTEVKTEGRHDPCLLPRFVPMGEAMVALVLVDHWLRQKLARLDG